MSEDTSIEMSEMCHAKMPEDKSEEMSEDMSKDLSEDM